MTAIPTPPTSVAEPGPPPRPLTSHVLRHSWTEPSVRLWWLLAIALAAVIGYFSFQVLISWRTETKLIREGKTVVAHVTAANGQSVVGMGQPPDSLVTLTFDWSGKPVGQSGYLAQHEGFVIIGEKVLIHVSPQDPSVWTNRVEPAPLVHVLFPGLIFLPGLPLLLAGAYIVRTRLVRLWTAGEATTGVIHTVRQSPIAPATYALRCTYRDRRGKRLFTVFVPKHLLANPEKGQTIWLLAPPVESTVKPVAWAWLV